MTADTIAYLGSPGTYSYQAAVGMFPDAEHVGLRTFGEIMETVEAGERKTAVIPIENSTSGRIPDVHRLMLSTEMAIVQERMQRIEHCLIQAHSGPQPVSELGSITRILSHRQGFLQSSGFIEAHCRDAEQIETVDTASAVKQVAELGDPHVAAIGSSVAAQVFGGVVIERDIADQKNNYTRFLALEKPSLDPDYSDATITTLIFQIDHQPGALIEALAVFRDAGINITTLETYTISEETALPTFYIDIGGGLEDDAVQSALRALEEKARYVKLLGSYVASDVRNANSGFLPVKSVKL
ncbi:prephenate dehydratase [Parasphingopyxis lamellibrachiae]|uniref:prephenate dehydratase n=1 Tax=Parasphingopyxis lamellibrachiae TaxID=680125 RepID=A0A3D9FI22_9SPHN|nr:prephenate dehydratase domain-containing protein [Parasphingopyxis lamellibrachiae]RED17443.1 prephenate dehydratase [Parasphingopyxis lamellibrachiae]